MAIDKELYADFKNESLALMDELDGIVEVLEEWDQEAFPENELKEFSQKVDRIMGAAKTLLVLSPNDLGIAFLGNICEMSKTMGYQAVAMKKGNLIALFAGFWAEMLELLREVLENLENPEKSAAVVRAKSPRVQARLAWLAEKVAPGNEEERQKVTSLLRKL